MKYMENIHSLKYKHWGLLGLRLALGIIFIYYGWGKLTNHPGITAFTGMVVKTGFPFPSFFAWVVALSEFIGGILLVAGVFVPYASILLGFIILVALFTIKKFQMPASSVDIAVLGGLLALLTNGAGKYIIGKKPHESSCCQSESHSHDDDCCKLKEIPEDK